MIQFMSRGNRARRWTPAIVLAVVTTVGGMSRAAGPAASTSQGSQQELLDEVRALRAEVDALKAARGQEAAPVAAKAGDPSNDVAATTAAVEKDADARPFSFAAASAVTGYDGKGFVLADESGNNVFRPGYVLQIRNNTDWRESGKGRTRAAQDDTENGWEIRRAKIYLTGNVFTPDLTYRFQLANQVNGPNLVLDDAWMAYHFYTGAPGKLSFKVGQFKMPLIHEEYEVGDEKQMAAERSLLNDTIGGGVMGPRTQGIELLWNSPSDILHGEAMLHDGSGNSVAGGASRNVTVAGKTTSVVFPGNVPGSVNTDYRDVKAAGSPIWGATGRLEYKAMGDWADYIEFTARAVKKDLLIIGGGVDVTEGVNEYYTHFAADVQYKSPSGLSLYAGGIGDFTDFRNIAGFNNNFDYGAIAQVGFAINHKIEPFVRVDAIKFDNDLVTVHDIVSEFTLGANYYLGEGGKYGHHAKFTLDASYLPIGSGFADHLNTDELNSGFKNEILVQAQFQLWL